MANHHHIYVVELDPDVLNKPKFREANPDPDPSKGCLYVGLTGLSPEERFRNHKAGHKASAIVRDHGLRLCPGLYEYLNPMPYEAAVRMEEDLAKDLRDQGYAVWQK